MKEILQDYSLSELQILMEEWGERKFRAAQIFRGLMQGKRVSDLSELSKTLRAKLCERFEDEPVKIRETFVSSRRHGKVSVRTCGREYRRRRADAL